MKAWKWELAHKQTFGRTISDNSFLNIFTHHAEHSRNQECGVTGRRYRYAEMRQRCQQFAASLRQSGLQPGDTLTIVMPNTAEWPIILLGAMEAGLLVSTTNPHYTAGIYTDTARSKLADMANFCQENGHLGKWEHKSAVWPLETKDPQIRTLYVPLGAFTATCHSNCVPGVKFVDWWNDVLHEMFRQKCRG